MTPVIITVGTIGNILSILVFGQKNLRSRSTSVLLIGLAIADTILLNIGLLPWWIDRITGTDIRKLSQLGCKIHVFFTYAPIHWSAWILVAVTTERLISVYLPLLSREIITRTRALISLVAIVICVSAIDVSTVWSHSLYFDESAKETCDAGPEQDKNHYHFKIYVWVDSFIASYLPFAIMLVSNVAIIIKLTKARLRRQTVMNVKSDTGSGMTAMLLTLNFVFLLTTSPIVILLAFEEQLMGDKSPHAIAKFYLAYTITGLLSYWNSALNFFLYCISGTRFRRDLVELFGCQGQIKLTPKSRSSTQTDVSTISKSVSTISKSNATPDQNNANEV